MTDYLPKVTSKGSSASYRSNSADYRSWSQNPPRRPWRMAPAPVSHLAIVEVKACGIWALRACLVRGR
jgi:hypothetical protein